MKHTPEELETIVDDHTKILGEIRDFMGNLSWLADISKATDLLKKPSLWLVAFVLGMVALFGGVKALFGFIISLFVAKN